MPWAPRRRLRYRDGDVGDAGDLADVVDVDPLSLALVLAVVVLLLVPGVVLLVGGIALLGVELLVAAALVPLLLAGRLVRLLPWPVTVEIRTGRGWRRVRREQVRGLGAARARVRELTEAL